MKDSIEKKCIKIASKMDPKLIQKRSKQSYHESLDFVDWICCVGSLAWNFRLGTAAPDLLLGNLGPAPEAGEPSS